MPGGAPTLAIARRAITVLEADASSRTLTIFERVDLRNEADAPFQPSMSGSQGPMGLLRFALPRNAFDLTLDERLSAYDVIQVDRGFASLMPLPSGTTNVQFSYRVPYAGGDYELATNAVYPTGALLVLLPDDFTTRTSDLRLERTADIGRQRFKVLIADDLAAGQRASVELGGLPFTPRPWYLDESLQRAVAVALAALGALFAWSYARVRGTSARAIDAPPARLADATDA